MRNRRRWMGLAVCSALLFAATATLAQQPPPPPPERPAQEQAPPAQQEAVPAEPKAQEDVVIVPAGTRLALVLQNSINSKSAQLGDSLYFETIYPVVVNNRILIPAGSFMRGEITHVKRPGRLKGRAELHLRLDELTLPNGYTGKLQARMGGAGLPDNAEVNRTEGGVKAAGTKSKDVEESVVYGGTGAGLGGAIGGVASGTRKGAGIGMGIGAAAGVAWALFGRGPELFLERGQTLEFVLNRDLALDAAMAAFDWTGQPSSLSGPGQRPETRRRLIMAPRIP